MNKKERDIRIIDELIEYTGLNIAQFSKSIGVSSQSIYDIQNTDKKNNISKKMVDKICDIYPSINRYYLLTGDGYLTNKEQYLVSSEKELISSLNKISKTIELIADAANKSKDIDLKNAEANLINARANEKIANAYVSNSEVLRMLSEYIIKEDKNR